MQISEGLRKPQRNCGLTHDLHKIFVEALVNSVKVRPRMEKFINIEPFSLCLQLTVEKYREIEHLSSTITLGSNYIFCSFY